MSKKVHDLYEENKKDEAIKVNLEESQRILSISLRHDGGNFSRVFNGFETRMKNRKCDSEENKVPDHITLGIDRLDAISYGGALIEDTVLWIMKSGQGKSIALRHHGMAAAYDGHPVLHIQLEGGVKACLDKYDQYWTGQEFNDIRSGFLKPEDQRQIMNAYKAMKNYGEDITVYGFEKFGEASMVEVRNIVLDYHKIYGFYPRVLILDSLDLVKTGINSTIDNNPNFKKDKLQSCAQLFKNLCVEFKMVGITATQTGNVPIEIWDNPEKVIDRSYTEGDRTLVKPFSFVFTGNTTREEKNNCTMRIYIDKLRDFKESQLTFPIATNYDKGRFYDKSRTIQLFSNEDERNFNHKKSKDKVEKLKRGERKVNTI